MPHNFARRTTASLTSFSVKMRVRPAILRLPTAANRATRPIAHTLSPFSARNASIAAGPDVDADLVSSHTIPPPDDAIVSSYDPVARAKGRRKALPPSRYNRVDTSLNPHLLIILLKISVSATQVLPRPVTPPPAASTFRSLLSTFPSRSLFPSPPRTDLSQYRCP